MDSFHDQDYQLLRQNNASLQNFETSLDAASNLLELGDALHANTSLKVVRANIHNSFSGQPPPEILVFFEALGSRPKLQKIFFGPLRYPKQARIPIQALSLSLIQASGLILMELCALELSGSMSDFNTLGAALQNHPSLQEVKIYNCQLAHRSDDESTAEIDTDTNADIDTYALNPLVKAIASIRPLQRLVLNASVKNELGKLEGESLGLLCLAPNLHSIGLLGFSLDETHMAAMIPGLAQNASSNNPSALKELCLGTVRLGTKGDKAFAQALESNRTLAYVDLQLEEGESPVHIAEALAENSNINGSLRHLFIHGDITPVSQKAFADAIQYNYVLESLELMNGSIHLPAIHFYLRMNALGRKELLEQIDSVEEAINDCTNKTKEKWMEVLISQRKDISSLFYLLSMNPLLCYSTRR